MKTLDNKTKNVLIKFAGLFAIGTTSLYILMDKASEFDKFSASVNTNGFHLETEKAHI